MDASLLQVFKIIVFSSVLFVWVVRYKNIVEEFKFFGYPDWLRDFVGILKISFVIMILSDQLFLNKFGSAGIVILMFFALLSHLKVKNPFFKMLPAISLLVMGLLFFYAAS